MNLQAAKHIVRIVREIEARFCLADFGGEMRDEWNQTKEERFILTAAGLKKEEREQKPRKKRVFRGKKSHRHARRRIWAP